METYYSLLGLPENANKTQIRDAYIKQAKQSHPDSAKTPQEAERLNELFILINKAYQILKDDQKRGEYDAYLKKKRLEKQITATKLNASTNKEPDNSTAPLKTGNRRPASPSQEEIPTYNSGKPAPARSESQPDLTEQFAQVRELLNAGNLAKAREKLRLVLKIDPNNALYCSYLASINAQLNTSLNEAHQFARKAIQIEPNNPLHHYHLGMVLEVAGHEQKAQHHYSKALELDPNFQDARKALQKFQHKESFWKKNFSGLFKRKD